MRTPRKYHGMAVLGGKIYAAGGFDGNKRTASVEAYDPATNSWDAVAPMRTGRLGVTLTAMQGKLLAVGGKEDRGDILATVEAYNVNTDSWEEVEAMAVPRHKHVAAGLE